MEAVIGYYDGNSFVPTKPIRAKKNQSAIITLLDESEVDPVLGTLTGVEGLSLLFDEAEDDFQNERVVSFPGAIDSIIAKYK